MDNPVDICCDGMSMEVRALGAELVTQVLTHWTHVSDPAFRVLVRMAVTALDKPNKGRPAAVYHGGRELLSMALRSKKGAPETRYRTVKRALAELTEAGAIVHLRSGWAGQNAVYRLTVSGVRDTDEWGVPETPQWGVLETPQKGGLFVQKWGVSETPPRNQEEPVLGAKEEEVVDVAPTSHPSRATGADVIQLFGDRCSKTPLQTRLDAIIAAKETS